MTGCGFCAHVWTVEDIFRTTKSILETRPIYHKCDDMRRYHSGPCMATTWTLQDPSTS
jgi:hypothetical protein